MNPEQDHSLMRGLMSVSKEGIEAAKVWLEKDRQRSPEARRRRLEEEASSTDPECPE